MITLRLIAATLTLLLLVTACGTASDTDNATAADESTEAATEAEATDPEATDPEATEPEVTEPATTEAEATEAPPEAEPAASEGDADTGEGEDGASEVVVADGQVQCTDDSIEAEVPEPALRQLVRDLIQDHVTRTHELVIVAGETGLDSAETEAAYTVLDVNGLELGDAVALVYDDGAGDAFVNIWRRHLQFFVDYAVGVATGDQAAQDAADADLRQYSQDFAAFFASATEGNMPAEPTVVEFDGHIDTVEALIRETLAGAETQQEAHDVAHDHVVDLAAMISNGVQAQFPCRFPAADETATATTRAKPVAAVPAAWTELAARVDSNCFIGASSLT
ncbi:hypothetical protein [Euzebya tangerina]|uniref:hypothetical protein n=1 Tax=Euzebya tangerina TaxID=591198 RepID=UPI000E30BD66|nr:hypothetical protein [Euzebya tangerina]